MSAEFPLDHEYIAPDRTDGPAPALILLHGRGANERDLVPVAEELPGDRHVISFRAPMQLGPGYTWYELDLSGGGLHASQPNPEDWRESMDALVRSIERAVAHYDLDPERMGVLGFSQGAVLSIGIMVEHPDMVSWIVALHGYLPDAYGDDELHAAADTPAFISGGTEDEVIPVTRVQDAGERLSAADVETTVRTYAVGHGISPDELADIQDWFERLGE